MARSAPDRARSCGRLSACVAAHPPGGSAAAAAAAAATCTHTRMRHGDAGWLDLLHGQREPPTSKSGHGRLYTNTNARETAPTRPPRAPRVSVHRTQRARSVKRPNMHTAGILGPYPQLPRPTPSDGATPCFLGRTLPASPRALPAPLLRCSSPSSPQTKSLGTSDPTCAHIPSGEQRSKWLHHRSRARFEAGLKPLGT